MNAIRALAPHASVQFDDGTDPAAAAALAARADVAIVFANQWELEGVDAAVARLECHDQRLGDRPRQYKVYVGSSSRDLRLQGDARIARGH